MKKRNEKNNMEETFGYFENIFEKAREKGFEIGKSREKVATAKRLKKIGLSIEQIAKGTDLPIEKVKEILNS